MFVAIVAAWAAALVVFLLAWSRFHAAQRRKYDGVTRERAE